MQRRHGMSLSDSVLFSYNNTSIISSKDLQLYGGSGAVNDGNIIPHLIVKADGKIGIGTNIPNDKLELNGNFSATYSFSGGTGLLMLNQIAQTIVYG